MTDDWTRGENGRSNTSDRFKALVAEVARLIRENPAMLCRRGYDLAGLIMAQLAHIHDLVPADEYRRTARELAEKWEGESKIDQAVCVPHPRENEQLTWLLLGQSKRERECARELREAFGLEPAEEGEGSG
jgi:hypothetical protein